MASSNQTPRATRYQSISATTPLPSPSHGARGSILPQMTTPISRTMRPSMAMGAGLDTTLLSPESASQAPQTAAGKETIHTVVRIRPDLDGHQANAAATKCVFAVGDGKHVQIGLEGRDTKTYKFDAVFGPEATQPQMFTIAKRFVDACLGGYNGTIFAYGQTGSGKTYTMLGNPSELFNQQSTQRGLIPQLLQAIFQRVDQKMSSDASVNIEVAVESLEIYNENIRDLLTDKPNPPSLEIKAQPHLHVPGLTRIPVSSYLAAIKLLESGSRARTIASTKMNDQSSRSHSVFTLNITTTDAQTNSKTFSRLNLVDLAGSESQKSAGTEGNRLKEAANINKSLSALVGYISYLSTQKNFVAHRNSKLTHLLSDSLGGNCKTTLIATINPSTDVYSDSLNTLNFAATAKEIKSDAKQNVSVNGQRIDAIALQKRFDALSKDHLALKKKHEGHDEIVSGLQADLEEVHLENWRRIDRELFLTSVRSQLEKQREEEDAQRKEIFEEVLAWNEEVEKENDELVEQLQKKDQELSMLLTASTNSAQTTAKQMYELQQKMESLMKENQELKQSLKEQQKETHRIEASQANTFAGMLEQMNDIKAKMQLKQNKRVRIHYRTKSELALPIVAELPNFSVDTNDSAGAATKLKSARPSTTNTPARLTQTQPPPSSGLRERAPPQAQAAPTPLTKLQAFLSPDKQPNHATHHQRTPSGVLSSAARRSIASVQKPSISEEMGDEQSLDGDFKENMKLDAGSGYDLESSPIRPPFQVLVSPSGGRLTSRRMSEMRV